MSAISILKAAQIIISTDYYHTNYPMCCQMRAYFRHPFDISMWQVAPSHLESSFLLTHFPIRSYWNSTSFMKAVYCHPDFFGSVWDLVGIIP